MLTLTITQIILMTPLLAYLCISDWRKRILPGAWVGCLAATGLIVDVCFGGWRMGVTGLLCGLACGLFLLIPFLLEGAGGGDLKMIAACGIWMGKFDVIPFLVFTCIAGFLLASSLLLAGHLTMARIKHYLRILFDWRYDRKAGREALPPKDDRRCGVPFGIAIACGVWMLFILRIRLLQTQTPI